MSKAKLAIEEFYSVAINPDLDYFAQLQPLAESGELANRITANQVLFRLCMIVDKQEKEIQALKDDRVAIAKKMIELEKQPEAVDPALPLG
jgi:ABC-type Na+ transport system ATPase subunit NatA